MIKQYIKDFKEFDFGGTILFIGLGLFLVMFVYGNLIYFKEKRKGLKMDEKNIK